MNDVCLSQPLTCPISMGPTELSNAKLCGLSFMLKKWLPRSSEFALPYRTPAALLGTAIHKFLEAVGRGDAGDPPELEKFGDIWDQSISSVESNSKETIQSCWIPLIDTAPDLERKRLFAFSTGERLTVVPRDNLESGTHSSSDVFRGLIDRIEVDPDGGYRIVDFKSGAVDTGGKIDETYCLQMRLYAALGFRQRGTWPKELILIDGDGNRHTVDFQHNSCADELTSANEFAESLISPFRNVPLTIASLTDALPGTPSPRACADCTYRPYCPSHCATLQREGVVRHIGPYAGPTIDICGRLSDQDSLSAITGGTALRLDHQDRQLRLRGHLQAPDFESQFPIEVRAFGVQSTHMNHQPSESASTTDPLTDFVMTRCSVVIAKVHGGNWRRLGI